MVVGPTHLDRLTGESIESAVCQSMFLRPVLPGHMEPTPYFVTCVAGGLVARASRLLQLQPAGGWWGIKYGEVNYTYFVWEWKLVNFLK